MYDETDTPKTHINTSSLESNFNIDTTLDHNEMVDQIKEMRNELMISIDTDEIDPDSILKVNIDRANGLLDILHASIIRGGSDSARLFEVAGQLVNAVTSAATSIQTSGFGMMKHEYNMKMASIKEREVAVKAALADKKISKDNTENEGGGNGSVIVMSREDLLSMIDEDTEVEIKSS